MFDERIINRPRPGYFKIRAARRSKHWLPARIERHLPMDPETGEILERAQPLVAYLSDKEADLDHVWIWGREITRDEYEWLTALHAIKTMP